MLDDATTGDCAGRPARRHPARRHPLRRAARACVWLAAAVVAPAHAGALYRCTGASGETVFTGSTAGFAGCKRIGSTPAPRPPRPALPAAAPAAALAASLPLAASPVTFAGVTGSVVTDSEPSASFAGVKGGVVTDAEARALALAALPPVTAPRGTWDYRESSTTDLAAAPAPEAPKGSRVLRGAVYRITRADGGVEYTNVPQPGGHGASIKMLFTYIATCAACDVHSRIDWNSVALNLEAFGDIIRGASAEYGVDEALLRAVIHAESAFNPRALSVAGAQGLMQLIPGTARDMGVLDAGQNIRGGARYLALLLQTFHGDERLAAAAYNAGPGAVQRYNGVPPYDETRVYVERVGVLRKRYAERLTPPMAAAGHPSS
jgi:hypothetical protein